VPDEIRSNLLRPGFTTRVAEWDTGLGLHEASEAAAAVEGRVEMFEPGDTPGVGFRFAMALCNGTPAGSPEARVCLEDVEDRRPRLQVVHEEALAYTFGAFFREELHVARSLPTLEA